MEYMKYVKQKFRVSWDQLKWAYFSSDDFVIGPKGAGAIQDKLPVQIILNSEGNLTNIVPYTRKLRKTNVNYTYNQMKDKWQVYMCRVCKMWLYAENKYDGIYGLIMNNHIKKKNNGIMIPQPQLGYKIKTPILRNFKLSELR
mmetsp:Transcript_39938/g.35644  ORF Transcript_39938/g.35644 Transcript_39938/m.35644 type:complete len:143 (-) Transcript_39938:151-579(-)